MVEAVRAAMAVAFSGGRGVPASPPRCPSFPAFLPVLPSSRDEAVTRRLNFRAAEHRHGHFGLLRFPEEEAGLGGGGGGNCPNPF